MGNEFKFTEDGKVIKCKGEKDFVSKISQALGISEILLSHNADGEIKRFDKL